LIFGPNINWLYLAIYILFTPRVLGIWYLGPQEYIHVVGML